MPGVKGQKWDREKRSKPEKKKVNTALPIPLYNKLKAMADKNKWSDGATLRHIVEEYFDYEE